VSQADRNADDAASTAGHMGQHVDDDTHVAWFECARASVTAWRAVPTRRCGQAIVEDVPLAGLITVRPELYRFSDHH